MMNGPEPPSGPAGASLAALFSGREAAEMRDGGRERVASGGAAVTLITTCETGWAGTSLSKGTT